jgi:hypothetical protein
VRNNVFNRPLATLRFSTVLTCAVKWARFVTATLAVVNLLTSICSELFVRSFNWYHPTRALGSKTFNWLQFF